jgi:EAL domain-containing protein (putative c-di-GMP-specific phosphodiesterase class I)
MTTESANATTTSLQWISNYYSPALIVDDDNATQHILTSYLNNLGFNETKTSHTGDQANTYLASGVHIGLIILELSTPHIDGIALIKDIALYQPDTSIIILSAYDKGMRRTAKLLAESYGLRVLDALAKPLKKRELYNVLVSGLGANFEHALVESDTSASIYPTKEEILSSFSNIHMHFQPKISLATGELVGCEALARMSAEVSGEVRLLTADYFIPYFEMEGRMAMLSESIIEKSLDALVVFQAAGLHISMSINLSMHDLEYSSLPDFVYEQICRRSLRPNSIILEITETSLSQSLSTCMETVSRLRLLGLNVSIDDFGTGFSSLKQLRDFPFNELKIDRSFIKDAVNDEGAKAIITACIGIAAAFNMQTVAEGIESKEQYDLLLNLGCDIGQGYLIATPLSQSNFLAWCKTRPCK